MCLDDTNVIRCTSEECCELDFPVREIIAGWDRCARILIDSTSDIEEIVIGWTVYRRSRGRTRSKGRVSVQGPLTNQAAAQKGERSLGVPLPKAAHYRYKVGYSLICYTLGLCLGIRWGS